MKKVLCCILVALGSPSIAKNVIFAWDPNPPHEKVETYVLYERVGEDYFAITSTPGTNVVVKDVFPGHHCYALKARNAWGESLFSNEVCVDVVSDSVDNPKDIMAPMSAVAALPSESYTEFEVSWQGSDGPGGSGIRNYDVYVSINDGPFQIWLEGTTATNGYFQGDFESVYAFYSVATDITGNREGAAALGDTLTQTILVNRPPQLQPFPFIRLDVGDVLILTNQVTDEDLPGQQLRFAICSDPVDDVILNERTGVFIWRPKAQHAGTTNQFCMSVFDNGSPNLASTIPLEVAVNDYLEMKLDDFAVTDGSEVKVPLAIFTSRPLRDIFFTLKVPEELKNQLRFIPAPGQFCSHYFISISPDEWYFMIRSCDVSPYYHHEYLGELAFTAQAIESKFVSLHPENLAARFADGIYLNRLDANTSRGALIKDTPMLDVFLSEGMKPGLVVYGIPGVNYVLERSVSSQSEVGWTPWTNISMTNVAYRLDSAWSGEDAYFRVRQADETSPPP